MMSEIFTGQANQKALNWHLTNETRSQRCCKVWQCALVLIAWLLTRDPLLSSSPELNGATEGQKSCVTRLYETVIYGTQGGAHQARLLLVNTQAYGFWLAEEGSASAALEEEGDV